MKAFCTCVQLLKMIKSYLDNPSSVNSSVLTVKVASNAPVSSAIIRNALAPVGIDECLKPLACEYTNALRILFGWTLGGDGIAFFILVSSWSPKQTVETDPIIRVNIITFRVFMRNERRTR